MKKLFLYYILMTCWVCVARAQEAFTIKNYEVHAKINKDASVNITETIDVDFSEPRHGIIRTFLFRYPISDLPAGIEKAHQQLISGNKLRLIIKDIKVQNHAWEKFTSGDLINIRIGNKDEYVRGQQQYIIRYTILNSINFFENYSEFYFNLVGLQWNTTIDKVNFSVELYDPLPSVPTFFIATGPEGSRENKTVFSWQNKQVLSGHTTEILRPYEGLTAGIQFPKGFLIQPDYTYYQFGWLVLPVLIFFIMYSIWKKWGKDEEITIQTEFYPPENVSPSVSGYIIDGKLDQRDLTALVPYWGAGGYLKINEEEEKAFFGLIKTKEYEFIKVKDLPETAPDFEKTLFDGIFKTGDKVQLSSLKNKLYTTMYQAKKELETKINQEDYYVTFSRPLGIIFPVLGIIAIVSGFIYYINDIQINKWPALAIVLSGLIMLIIGIFMPKKTKKGTVLYAKLLGFKEFLKSVEKDRLKEFLKQDEHYFDKVLPYAIVFDIADTWKDKLKGLDIPPPTWYTGTYIGGNFNSMNFMNNLDKSMNAMSRSFYSSPSGGAGSGGSFSGGGGFSGGGFGGGGGSSW